ncbi:MAG: GatB/YqeY domain-containing protein [Bdellovibrionales bacterium]
MSEKRTELNNALKSALKAKDQVALSTTRLINAAIKDRDIAARAKGETDGISDDEILSLLQSMVKQRKDSSRVYRDGGREELAVREEEEIKIIQNFLPAQLSDEEVTEIIRSIIDDIGAKDIKDMGKVMGVLKGKYAGQIDMGKASGLVKTVLN